MIVSKQKPQLEIHDKLKKLTKRAIDPECKKIKPLFKEIQQTTM